MHKLINIISVGSFLAVRQIKRSGKWTTALIVSIMTLTFLNMVVVSGILVGLIEGSSTAYRAQYSGDILISRLPTKNFIERSPYMIETLKNLPQVKAVSARYYTGGSIEANYKSKDKSTDLPDSAAAVIVGVNPADENAVGNLKKLVVDGDYLLPNEEGQVLVGSGLLAQYSVTPSQTLGLGVIENADVGSKILVKIGDISREVTIKGVVKSKIGEVSRRVFFTDRELAKITGRDDNNVGEIAVLLNKGEDPVTVVNQLTSQGFENYGLVQTWKESQGEFFDQIAKTFGALGNIIGTIGIAIASITIFIVVFINAITRRRFIGVLKGIGIEPASIQMAYVAQALFYSFCGIAIGAIIIFAFLKPFITSHPINFPFSDGILVATSTGTFIRAVILFIVTALAGFVPSRMIVRQKTLDAILGR